MKDVSKKLLTAFATSAVMIAAGATGVLACTTIYVGGNRVEEGTPFVARTEDYGSNMNKMWFISEAGAWKEGEQFLDVLRMVNLNGILHMIHTDLHILQMILCIMAFVRSAVREVRSHR